MATVATTTVVTLRTTTADPACLRRATPNPCPPAFQVKYPPVGEVLELADRTDLGSVAARREGSNPSFPTLSNACIACIVRDAQRLRCRRPASRSPPMRAQLQPDFVMAYSETAAGRPLLLIHGFPLNRHLWRPQLEGLASEARVIAPDLRGFGDTT